MYNATFVRLKDRLGWTGDDAPLQLALTHRSRSVDANNERLEFLGDSVLDLVIGGALLMRHPTRDEGWLSQRRAQIVCTPALARLARDWQLGHLLEIDSGAERDGARDNDRILASTVEAVIGAFYQRFGFAETVGALCRVFGTNLNDGGDIVVEENPKTVLQNRLARAGRAPRYVVGVIDGETVAYVYIQEALIGRGVGPNKKAAERAAAEHALRSL